jgi:trigger factor
MATFREPTDRKIIQNQDLVSVDTTLLIDGVIDPKGSNTDEKISFYDELPETDFIKSALLGKQIGDEVSVAIPEEEKWEEQKEKDCRIIFRINSIKERMLPNIDDNLAKDVSDKFSTLDQLKESIRLSLTITAKRRYEYLKQETITKALIDKNPFLVPPALVERMALSLINRELEAMGEKVSSELVKNHWQEMWDSVQERAQFRVKAELLFESLIKSLEIKTTEEEILNKVNSLKNISKEDAQYSLEIEKLLNIIEQQGQVTIISESIIQKGQ